MAIKKLTKKPEQTVESDTTVAPVQSVASEHKPRLKERLRAFVRTKKGKLVAAVCGVVLLFAVLAAIPFTRYGIAGLVIKKDVSVTLHDTKTGKPVGDAKVSLGSYSTQTDANGHALLKSLPVGQYQLVATKQLYKPTNIQVTVPILGTADAGTVTIEAAGRQVPISVTNTITAKAVAGAKLTAGEATALTDDKGEATIIVPADTQTFKLALQADGYNAATVELAVKEQLADQNKLKITPSGKIYFLSKRTGTINVMKSNLDGSDAQVVIQGTGKEEDRDTYLVASRDWKYLALKSRRDSDKAKLYLIKTENDSMTVMDEGDARFSLLGWADHYFAYSLTRNNISYGSAGKEAIKSYNAETGQLKEIDKIAANQHYGDGAILSNNEVFVSKFSDGGSANKASIYSLHADGSNAKTIIEGQGVIYGMRLYKPSELYILDSWSENKQYEYEKGKLTEVKADVQQFYKSYPTYLFSPSDQQTFWTDSRDGKSVLLTGDNEGGSEKLIASLSDDYKQYGWFTNDYLLASKANSELYILSSSGGTPLKITDYHKPSESLTYGGGYGGY